MCVAGARVGESCKICWREGVGITAQGTWGTGWCLLGGVEWLVQIFVICKAGLNDVVEVFV